MSKAAKFQVGDLVRCVDLSGGGTGEIMADRIRKKGSDIFQVTKLCDEADPHPIVFVDGHHGSRDGAYAARFELAYSALDTKAYDEALEAQEAYQAIVGS